jgi:hypothetical protein
MREMGVSMPRRLHEKLALGSSSEGVFGEEVHTPVTIGPIDKLVGGEPQTLKKEDSVRSAGRALNPGRSADLALVLVGVLTSGWQ